MHVNVQIRTDIIATYDIKKIECTIGSSKKAQIVLKDNSVYPEHATFSRYGDKIYITPSEKAEVYLNANQLESPQVIKENDIINIGPYSLIILGESEDGLLNKIQFINFTNHKFTKLLISVIALIALISGILYFLDEIPTLYHFDSVKAFQKAEQLVYSNNDLEEAKRILEKINKSDNSDNEASDLLQHVNRQIRIKNAVNDAHKILNTKSFKGSEESVIELSDVLNELTVVGLDPSNQIKIREVLNELEEKKK